MQKARIVIISKDNPRKRCSGDERGNEPMTNAFNHDARCLVKPAITVVLYVLSTSSVFRKAKMRRDGKLSGDYGCNGKNIMGNTHIMILYFETHSSLSITHLSASTLPLHIFAHIRCQSILHYPLYIVKNSTQSSIKRLFQDYNHYLPASLRFQSSYSYPLHSCPPLAYSCSCA